jgi:23S rRNA pseudouridine1911/1915/1917 synthase
MKHLAKRDGTILEILGDAYAGTSTTKLRKMLKFANVTLDGEQVRMADTPVKLGQLVNIEKQEKPSINVKAPFRVIWQDQYIIVCDKPVGLITAGEGITRRPTMHKLVDDYVKDATKGAQSAFPVHRLDKEVGGLVVFAKSEEIQEKLKSDWHQFSKKYIAITEKEPNPKKGTISTLLEERGLKMFVASTPGPNTKEAVTYYTYKERIGRYHMVEVELATGKKNQIRVHLGHIGCPIVGDYKYGASNTFKRQIRLMATQLYIKHPITGKDLAFKIEPSTIFTHPKEKSEDYR